MTPVPALAFLILAASWAPGRGALAQGPGALASGKDAPEEKLSDPEMLAEMGKVEDSNLEAAMGRASADADKALESASQIVAATRRDVAAAAAELNKTVSPGAEPAPGSLGENREALELAAQMLEAKAEEFRSKAAGASLKVPDLAKPALARARAGYRAKDRQRDLQRARAYLAQAEKRHGRKSKLSTTQGALLESLEAYLTELRAARELLAASDKLLAARRQEAAHLASLARSMGERSSRAAAAVSDLGREVDFLETALRLAQHDELEFDMPQKAGSKPRGESDDGDDD